MRISSAITIRFVRLGMLLAVVAAARAQTVIFVDDDAAGNNDGSSWVDAFRALQDALSAARKSGGVVVEVRAAQGIYQPDRGAGQVLGDREATFHLVDGVALRGGYAGAGAPDPDARNPALYETVLSGDLGNPKNRGDNSFQIVACTNLKRTTVLDGFTITCGDNFTDDRAAGMHNIDSDPQVLDCIFIDNFAPLGAAMYNLNSSPTVTRCSFILNAGGGGCGIYNIAGSDAVISRCVFLSNLGIYGGGGIYNESSSPLIDGCVFVGNVANWEGGGINNNRNSRAIIRHCTFSGNVGGVEGGGISNEAAATTVQNCILWGNQGGEIVVVNPGKPISVSFCDVEGGFPGNGNINDNPLFERLPQPGPDGFWGTADDDPGDLHLRAESPCIDTGDPGFMPEPSAVDMDGQKRLWNGRVDMGTDEFGSFVFGDINCDESVSAFDIEPFLLALFEPGEYAIQFPDCEMILADINGDGNIDAFDIEPFLDLLFR